MITILAENEVPKDYNYPPEMLKAVQASDFVFELGTDMREFKVLKDRVTGVVGSFKIDHFSSKLAEAIEYEHNKEG